MELGKVEGNGPNDTFPGVAVFTLLSVIGVLKNIRSVVTHNISALKVDLATRDCFDKDRASFTDRTSAQDRSRDCVSNERSGATEH
jgi:hypothetical protein